MTSKVKENKSPSLLDLEACVCANLRKTTRVVTQLYDSALSPVGLRATQFTVLATLAMAGGAPLTQLAEALVMDRTTLTRNLKPLINRGLVRVENDKDQRVRRIQLTDDGMKLFQQARPRWAKVQARLVAMASRRPLGRSADNFLCKKVYIHP
jgi:DNA-binding MarR family transcriptional regulator